MTRKLMVAAVVAVLVGLVPAVEAGATGTPKPPDLVCPDGFVNLSTSVRLRHDVTCGIFVTGGDSGGAVTVTIDLAGHTLTGDVGWDFDATLTVKNGTVEGTVGSKRDSGADVTVSKVRVRGDVNRGFDGSMAVRDSKVDGAIDMRGMQNIVERSVVGGGIYFDDTNNGMKIAVSRSIVHGSGITLNLFGLLLPRRHVWQHHREPRSRIEWERHLHRRLRRQPGSGRHRESAHRQRR